MNMINTNFWVILLLILAFPVTTHAKTYKPINEIPREVPENDEEKGVWRVGIAHQEKMRGSEELVNNPALEEYLEGVMSRLMGAMVGEIGLEVDVLVFKDPTVNAWAYPNGTVAVQTGLLAAMENEAQLAAIMGHEVSHYLNRHAYIQIKSKQTQSLIGKGLGALATLAVASETGTVDTSLLDSGQVWTDLVTSGYSRKLETAADEQGLEFMIAAGYPPDQAIPAFESMRTEEDDVIDVKMMWSSHPDIDARKKNLSKQIKKADVGATSFGLDSESYLRAIRVAALVNSQLQVENRQFEIAISRLEKYTQVLSDDESGFYLLGEAYRKQNPEGNIEARMAAYQNALAINASFSEPYRELGLAFRQQGQKEKALQALSEYLVLAPSAADVPIIIWYRDNLANANPLSAQQVEAIQKQFASLYPENPSAEIQAAIEEHTAREVFFQHPVNGLVGIQVMVVPAPFANDKAKWHGTSQKVEHEGDGFFGTVMGKDYGGHIAASSIRILISDRTRKIMYNWSGGVEVMMQRNGEKLEALPRERLWQEEKRVEKAVKLALKPF